MTCWRLFLPLSVVAFAFCGGGAKSPQSPTPPNPAPQPWSLSGRLVTTLAGGPVANANVNATIATAASDSDGRFTLTSPTAPSGSQRMTVSADGYRQRETLIRLPRTDALVVDIISTAPPFDETFYNELARDAFDSPSADYPLFRWSSALKFYLKTVDENGRPLSGDALEVVRRGLRNGVHYYTAATYDAVIEEGTEDRPERNGYVNVIPRQVIEAGDYCGYASSVGGNPSTIQLRIDRCGCGRVSIPIDVVLHEVGHAVGMFHVNRRDQIMHPSQSFGCREVIPSALEQHHAALMYARPRGNRSPDSDPGNFTLANPLDRIAGAPGRPKRPTPPA